MLENVTSGAAIFSFPCADYVFPTAPLKSLFLFLRTYWYFCHLLVIAFSPLWCSLQWSPFAPKEWFCRVSNTCSFSQGSVVKPFTYSTCAGKNLKSSPHHRRGFITCPWPDSGYPKNVSKFLHKSAKPFWIIMGSSIQDIPTENCWNLLWLITPSGHYSTCTGKNCK